MTHHHDSANESAAADGGTDVITSAKLTPADTNMGDEQSEHLRSQSQREFLLETIRRAPLLLSLQTGPADVSTLAQSVEMSRSTVHRATNTLEENGLISQSDGQYHLTNLGRVVTDEIAGFSTRTRTAISLKQFLNSIQEDTLNTPLDYFADADIIRREPRRPHATIHRILELIEEEEDSLRMFSTVISPVYVDVGYQQMMNGVDIEAIFDREVIEIMLSEYPEKAHETISTGNFTVHAHDGLPFEMFLFEDKVGLAAHNQNGNAEMLVECTDPEAIDWAETLYQKHLSQAETLDFPDA